MARHLDKQRAIELRLEGFSYSQIRKEIEVGKGTLSDWLSDYPLSKERIRELRDLNEIRIENFSATTKKNREDRLNKICAEENKKLFPLSDRDLFLAGLFLYWGEGGKTRSSGISVSNTDPAMLKFFIYWIINHVGLPKSKINATLHLYSDMDINKEVNFWSKSLGLPREQFNKPYVKTSLAKNISYKNGFGHGTCNLRIFNARIAEQVLMGLKALQNYFLNLTRV